MLTGITHITLFASNLDEALGFYKKLGFVIHTDAQLGPMRWLTLNLPEQPHFELVLMEPEDEQEKKLIGKQAGSKPLICIASSNCRQDYEKLKSAGIEFVDAPNEEPWGIAAMLKDLYGNLIYIVEEVKK